MPTVLSDPSSTLYAILLIMVFVLTTIWFRNKKRGNLIRLLIGVGALVGLFLTDYFFESPREEATRKIKEMAQASQDKPPKWDDLFKHVSDSFKYGAKDKKGFREFAERSAGMSEFKGVSAWDFHRADFRPIDNKNFKIGFRAQPTGYPDPNYQSWIIATFTQDPDEQWRMSGFTRYDFMKQDREPAIPIPGLD